MTATMTQNNPRTRRSSNAADFTRDTIKLAVRFSTWDGKVYSDKGVDDVAKAENAAHERIEVRLRAIPRASQRKIYQVKQAMIDVWHGATRPWEDGGWRLGLVSEYAETITQLEELQRQFRDAVRECIDKNYNNLKDDFEKHLNGLAQDMFPSKAVLLQKYNVRICTDKVASHDDFRFSGITAEEAERIAETRENYLKEIVMDGNRALLTDVAEVVEKLIEVLKDDEVNFRGTAETGFPIFRNVENMLDRCDKLNVTRDAAFAQKVENIRKTLRSIDPTSCKADPKVRKQAVKTAKTMLDELASF